MALNGPESTMRREVIRMRNDMADLPMLMQGFERFCKDTGVPRESILSVLLCLEELVVNTIWYGYEEEVAGEIETTTEVGDGKLTVTIKDDARQFDPFDHQMPDVRLGVDERRIGGLGIHLTFKFMDHVDYTREGGNNVVRISKNLPPAAGPGSA
ncbi:ATP-binding protein [soil metagenome]